MEPTKEQLEQLKQIELDMLKEFVRVCKMLGLKYYLLGGTLLGAVRHKGFIPWDDDIDVGMPRLDYEKFIKDGQSLLSKHLFLQNIYTDKEYPMCFSKIRNNNTTFIESAVGKLKINHGVYIDVFPLDFYPDSLEEQKKLKKNEIWYKRRISCQYTYAEDKSNVRKIKDVVIKTLFPSAKYVAYKRENLYKSITQGDRLINHGGAWGEKEIIPADWYGEGIDVVFEGLCVKAPKEYDKWLTQVYGDYMQLPPIEKRVGHHYTDIVDLEKTYLEYIRE